MMAAWTADEPGQGGREAQHVHDARPSRLQNVAPHDEKA